MLIATTPKPIASQSRLDDTMRSLRSSPAQRYGMRPGDAPAGEAGMMRLCDP
jgi:hypothetical protein